MFEDVIVLSANAYDFKDKDTNRDIKGVTVWILPFNQSDENVNGIKPVKYSLPYDAVYDFESTFLPAYAKMSFSMDFARSKIVPKKFTELKTLEL